ncbi:MAG TPA: tetratricopeptide repeat protein [Rectinemataceae bacterium]
MENKATTIRPDTKAEEKSFAEKLSDFIGKHKLAFLAVLGVFVAALAIVGATSIVSNSIAEKSSRAMEETRAKIAPWRDEQDATKKAELETALFASLDSVIKKWPRSFAAQQALFTKAGIYSSKKEWESAEKAAVDAADKRKNTYLAPMALEMAAVAAEEQGKHEIAIGHYTRIVEKYTKDNPNLAHARFSLGRLKESASDWKGAYDSYEALVSSQPESDWAKLAKDRIIYLKSAGHIQQ